MSSAFNDEEIARLRALLRDYTMGDGTISAISERVRGAEKRIRDLEHNSVQAEDVEDIARQVRDEAIPEEIWHRLRECEDKLSNVRPDQRTMGDGDPVPSRYETEGISLVNDPVKNCSRVQFWIANRNRSGFVPASTFVHEGRLYITFAKWEEPK